MMADWVDVTTVLANVAAFVGAPLAILIYATDRRRARLDREQQTYQALQSEYSDFLRLCLENPELQLHDWRPDVRALTPEQQGRRMVALEILVSMFESAFVLYHGHRSAFRRRQWDGWHEFMRDWARREDFRAAWKEHLGSQFDSGFVTHMDGLVAECERPAS
jgi:hypothetical protein